DLRERLAFYRQRYSPSQLVALSDEHYAGGLARIEAVLEGAGPGPVLIPSHICLVTVSADKP
ncbi:MAG TPA: hypothetical protein VGP93_17215, partial [Polyangiaceae bacterium]|nr:hypothetical protein [Polyangiaceae bacterium]